MKHSTSTALPTTGAAQSNSVVWSKHEQYFSDREVDPADAASAGCRSVDGFDAADILDRPEALPCDGIAFIYPDTAPPYCRVRMDDADACGARYLCPAGRPVEIYTVLGIDYDGANRIVVVESPTKALLFAQRGHAAVGLGGVATTLELAGRPRLASTWDRVPVAGKEIVIVFDANRGSNVDVARAEARLASALKAAGAHVKLATLDTIAPSEDMGPDDVAHVLGFDAVRALLDTSIPADPVTRVREASDPSTLYGDLNFLASVDAGGPVATIAVKRVLRERKCPIREFDSALRELRHLSRNGGGASNAPSYAVVDGQLCSLSDAGEARALINGDVRITAARCLSDGAGTEKTTFTLVGELADGTELQPVRCTAQQLARTEGWVDLFAGRLIAYGRPDEIMAGVQSVSGFQVQTVYTHTGFAKRGDKVVFLHGGGAIGDPTIRTELDEKLTRYKLPGSKEDAPEALRLALRLLDLSNPAVGVLLLGAVALAPLSSILRPAFAIFIHGQSNVMKTTVVRTALSFFCHLGPDSLTVDCTATFAAIEYLMFAAKDVLVGIDDYRDRPEIVATMSQVIRAIGNGQGRSRMRADLTKLPDRPPRGLACITGEQAPAQELSEAARTLLARQVRADVNIALLDELQERAPKLPAAMTEYVSYLGRSYGRLEKELPQRVLELRPEFADPKLHARVPDALATVLAAIEIFATFAVSREVLSEPERAELLLRVMEGLRHVANQQQESMASMDPADRFVESLQDLLASGDVVVAPNTVGGRQSQRRDRASNFIGWRDGEKLLLLKGPTFAAVKALCAKLDQPLRASASEILKRLLERGLIEPGTEREHPYEVRRQIGSERIRVVALKMAGFDGGGGDETKKRKGKAREPVVPSDDARRRARAAARNGSGTPGWTSIVDRAVGFRSVRTNATSLDTPSTARASELPTAFDVARHSSPTDPPLTEVHDLRISGRLLGWIDASDDMDAAMPKLMRESGAETSSELGDAVFRAVQSEDLERVWRLEHQLVPIVSEMQERGVPVDASGWKRLVDHRASSLARLEEQLREIGLVPSEANEPDHVREVLRQLGIHVDATDRAGLEAFRDVQIAGSSGAQPLRPADLILQFRAEKAFLAQDYKVEGDGPVRLRPRIDALGADTGRFTTTNPNLLGLESRDDVRACVVAPEGHVIIAADYSAADLRALAAITEDARLLEIFAEGRNVHAETAMNLYNLGEPPAKGSREYRAGKIVNLAIVNGMTAHGIARQLHAAGVCDRADETVGQDHLDAYYRAYPRVAAYYDGIRSSEFAVMRTSLGRIRRFRTFSSLIKKTQPRDVERWKAHDDRARMNFMMQGTTSDALKLALVASHGRLAKLGACVLLPVHDELVIEAPEDVAEAARDLVVMTMKSAMDEVLGFRVPVQVEARIGRTWAST